MLILKITEPELNVFMARLLKEDTFDAFEVRGLEVSTFTNFQISGAVDASFDEDTPEDAAYCRWERIKPFAVSFIKGKKRPSSVNITLSYPPESAKHIHPNSAALFLNINYEHGELHVTTAVSQRNFSLDKSVEGAWDDHINAFFASNNIPISVRL